MHSSGTEPVTFYGAQSVLGRADFSFGGHSPEKNPSRGAGLGSSQIGSPKFKLFNHSRSIHGIFRIFFCGFIKFCLPIIGDGGSYPFSSEVVVVCQVFLRAQFLEMRALQTTSSVLGF